MTEHEVERRLAAVVVADMVGYSRLMGADEEGTLAALMAHRDELIDPKIAEHHGRIVKTTGDGLLVEFASVVDALKCCVDVQREMTARNRDVVEDRRITFRVGINLGDIIIQGDDIFGDGVNVAARLEELAEPGGILISRKVFDEVRSKLALGFEALGEQRVKNIAEPIPVYRVLTDPEAAGTVAKVGGARRMAWRWPLIAAAAVALMAVVATAVWLRPWAPDVAPASLDRMAFPLPEKPSIAVLPFENLSGDPDQEHMADGFTENIISALSKIPEMLVIARNSVFTYKGKPVQVQRVAEEQGVRYVLEGSVQRIGDRLRITARLVDAITGNHLWSERYDREVTDIFALQDDITLKIVEALQVELTEGELARIRLRSTNNLNAWLLLSQGLTQFLRLTKESNIKARELAEKARMLDPEYAGAYTHLGWTHWLDAQAGWSKSRQESLGRAVEFATESLKRDDSFPDTFTLLSAIHLILGQHDQAIAYGERAIALSPNHSVAIALLGLTMNYSGEPEKAIVLLQKAMRLSPYYQDWYLGELGRAYYLTDQYQEALDALQQRLRRNPNSSEAHVLLAATYGKLDRLDEARAALAKFLEPRPYYTLRHYAAGEFYRISNDLNRVLDGLRIAGLPE